MYLTPCIQANPMHDEALSRMGHYECTAVAAGEVDHDPVITLVSFQLGRQVTLFFTV